VPQLYPDTAIRSLNMDVHVLYAVAAYERRTDSGASCDGEHSGSHKMTSGHGGGLRYHGCPFASLNPIPG